MAPHVCAHNGGIGRFVPQEAGLFRPRAGALVAAAAISGARRALSSRVMLVVMITAGPSGCRVRAHRVLGVERRRCMVWRIAMTAKGRRHRRRGRTMLRWVVCRWVERGRQWGRRVHWC